MSMYGAGEHGLQHAARTTAHVDDPMNVAVLERIEKLARTLRYRITRECIPAVHLDQFTDRQLVAMLITDSAEVLASITDTEH